MRPAHTAESAKDATVSRASLPVRIEIEPIELIPSSLFDLFTDAIEKQQILDSVKTHPPRRGRTSPPRRRKSSCRRWRSRRKFRRWGLPFPDRELLSREGDLALCHEHPFPRLVEETDALVRAENFSAVKIERLHIAELVLVPIDEATEGEGGIGGGEVKIFPIRCGEAAPCAGNFAPVGEEGLLAAALGADEELPLEIFPSLLGAVFLPALRIDDFEPIHDVFVQLVVAHGGELFHGENFTDAARVLPLADALPPAGLHAVAAVTTVRMQEMSTEPFLVLMGPNAWKRKRIYHLFEKMASLVTK